jgi:hypothetical protein
MVIRCRRGSTLPAANQLKKNKGNVKRCELRPPKDIWPRTSSDMTAASPVCVKHSFHLKSIKKTFKKSFFAIMIKTPQTGPKFQSKKTSTKTKRIVIAGNSSAPSSCNVGEKGIEPSRQCCPLAMTFVCEFLWQSLDTQSASQMDAE